MDSDMKDLSAKIEISVNDINVNETCVNEIRANEINVNELGRPKADDRP